MIAKHELLDFLSKHNVTLKCATIQQRDYDFDGLTDEDNDYCGYKHIHYDLKLGYSKEELEAFLESINFNYDNCWGGKELFGTMWFNERDTYAVRGEYDGSEWWEFREIPEIPMYLNNNNK